MLQSLTINFKGTRILLKIQKQFPRGVLQTCSKYTGEHPCICVVFINLNSGFECSVNLLHICRIPYSHFVRKPLGERFWIFFSWFSQLIFNLKIRKNNVISINPFVYWRRLSRTTLYALLSHFVIYIYFFFLTRIFPSHIIKSSLE